MIISRKILEELIADSHQAFHTVFKMAYPKVYAFSLGLLKNEADAEDVAQLVFIILWTKRASLAKVHNFDAYLYTMTRNTVLNHIAANKILSTDVSDIADMAAKNVSPIEQVEAHDLQLLVDMVVDHMPLQRQNIYRLSREEGLTNDQIAERLDIQKKTVENHINLALKEIRHVIKKTLILLLSLWV